MSLHKIIKKGATDRSIRVRILDSTDGTPETAVAHNTSGIAMWYEREGFAKTAISLVALSALTDAHTDGGFLHVGDGSYRLDVPDAAFATGVNAVHFGGTVTGMIVSDRTVQLVNYDPEDAVRAGLTALPNAAAGATGGLPTVDASNDVGAQVRFKRAVAVSNFHFLMQDTDGVAATGLTVTAQRVIDGGALGSGTLGAVSEIGSGLYRLNIPGADLDGDTVTLVFTATGAKTRMITLYPEPA